MAALQLLPEPWPVRVETEARRDHDAPVRFRLERRGGGRGGGGGSGRAAVPFAVDGWQGLPAAAAPERISGGHWQGGFAREYFRCVGADGTPLWLFRDPLADRWFLHGWWD